jgi:signal transduction histidine kinase
MDRNRDFRHTLRRVPAGYNGAVSGEPAPTDTWRNAAAFGTWFVVALPTLGRLLSGSFSGPAAVIWAVAFATFGAALVPCLVLHWLPSRRLLAVALLMLQSVAGLTMVASSGSGTSAATLVIVAAEVASVFPPRIAWIWVAAQSVLVGVIWARYDTLIGAVAAAGAFAGFQAFALATIALEHRERAARQELTRANAELLATRSLLAENTRVAERIRIARDLHDTLGHHLTALTLQLDVASRLSSGQAAAHVQEAHAIARLLLSDVRSVVSEMRDTSRLNLGDAVRALTGAAGAMRVHLEMPESVDVADAAQAHAMLRCVQEIITNAARHAAAPNLWIVIESRADGIALHARDDGRGSAAVTWGNGLRGMRERFAEHAGRVEFASAPGRGFEVHGFMPRAEAAS